MFLLGPAKTQMRLSGAQSHLSVRWPQVPHCLFCHCVAQLSLVVRKPVFGNSDQVTHKPGCTTTQDGKKLEISDVGSRGIVLSV